MGLMGAWTRCKSERKRKRLAINKRRTKIQQRKMPKRHKPWG